MRPITQYALYFVAGFLQLWLLLLYWGFSAGPANALPFILLLAFLELGLIASGLSLFLEMLGALAAVLGAAVGLCWPIAGLLSPSTQLLSTQLIEAAIVGILPLVVTVDGFWRLVARRRASWFEIVEGPSLLLRTALAVLPFAVVSVIALPMVRASEERYVIPEGYMGEVVIVHGLADGAQEGRTASRTKTYDIPETGILIATGQPERGWVRDKYFYRRRDGSLEQVRNIWNSTIHDTPANRADPSVGIYLRTGNGVSNSPACSFEFHSFVVGTKTFIVSDYAANGRRAWSEVTRLVCESTSQRERR